MFQVIGTRTRFPAVNPEVTCELALAPKRKPAKTGPTINSERTLKMYSSPSNMKSIKHLCGTGTWKETMPSVSLGDSKRPHTWLQPPPGTQREPLPFVIPETLKGLCDWFQPLPATVPKLSCWHRDLVEDTPACTSEDPEMALYCALAHPDMFLHLKGITVFWLWAHLWSFVLL